MSARLWMVITLSFTLVSGLLSAKPTMQLREDHPKTYTVKKGDTLWDISKHFLHSPWLWPRLWQANEQVKNPHLIYPGDVLYLIWVDGEPRLVHKKMLKLSPQVRVEQKPQPVPTLPLSEIGPFLQVDHIFEGKALDQLPFVLGDNQSHFAMLSGEHVYIRGQLEPGVLYGIYRPGKSYTDAKSGEKLGQEALFIGVIQAKRQESSSTSSGVIRKITRAVRQGDKLMPLPKKDALDAYFLPHEGGDLKDAYVIDIPGNLQRTAKYGVVLINKGTRDQVQVGDVYAVDRPGVDVVIAPGKDEAPKVSYKSNSNLYQSLFSPDAQQLPDQQIARLMVFKVYDKMSFALVLDSFDTVHENYRVGEVNPS